MKGTFFLILIVLGMGVSTEEGGDHELAPLKADVLCAGSAMLAIYAPLHTIAWCILNHDEGYKACLEEALLALGTSVSMWVVTCILT